LCIPDGPSVEADWQYYQQMAPGQVQVVGVDCWNGTTAQLDSYKSQTGSTFPLFLNGTLEPGGNLYGPYLDTSNYIVINKQGVIRYHAYDLHPAHARRYYRSEIRGAIDSLVSSAVGVEPGAPSTTFALSVWPNPAHGAIALELMNLGNERVMLVTLHDLGGRRMATLWDGTACTGVTRVAWDGALAMGMRAPAGVYLVRATLGTVTLTRRIVRLP
jgi:hypothetical protein